MFQFFRRLLYGRYGQDALGQALLLCALIVAGVWSLTAIRVLAYLLLVLLALYYYRVFSTKIAIRQGENQRFLQWWLPKKKAVSDARMRFRDRKVHRYYRCKSCKTYLRVPRGKGKINIKCPKCGSQFVKKT